MKRNVPWLLTVAASLVAVTAMVWSWNALRNYPLGTVEVTFFASKPVSVSVFLNNHTRKAARESISSNFGSGKFDQTAGIPIHVPEIRNLSVALAPVVEPPPELRNVEIRSSSGDVLWKSEVATGEWSFEKPVKLRKLRYAMDAPMWLTAALSCLGMAPGIWLIWRAFCCLRRFVLHPVGFASVVLLGCAVAALSYLAVIEAQRGAPVPGESWVHDVMLEKMAIASAFKSPRTLVVGGSSGLYGVDASWLTTQSGQPVINLALHAGLPLGYHLDRCLQVLQAGDSVLLHLEYPYWASQPEFNAWQIDQALSWASSGSSRRWLNPTRLTLLTHVPPERVLSGMLAAMFAGAFQHPEPTWVEVPGLGEEQHFGVYRAAINSHGDLLAGGPPPGRRPCSIPYLPGVFDPNLGILKELGAFIAEAASRGARVFVAFPATIRSEQADFLKPGPKAWTDAASRWVESRGAMVLGRPEDTQLDINFFLDTPYHLIPEGRRQHTATLFRLLRAKGWPDAGSR